MSKKNQRQEPSFQSGCNAETYSSHLLQRSVPRVNFVCRDLTTCYSSREPALNTRSKFVRSINLPSSSLHRNSRCYLAKNRTTSPTYTPTVNLKPFVSGCSVSPRASAHHGCHLDLGTGSALES